ncbi:glutathione S-transferase N-terminal domain-containing protein [soil metagenome]
MPTSPIEVHYWPTPNGRKVVIALEEMGLPYTIVHVNIGKGEQFTPEFLAISPNNRMPAIVDPVGPDGKPISVFESGAILQYLARKTGQFYGADERSRVCVDEWLFWQMAGLGPMGGQAHHFRGYAPTFLKDSRNTAYGAARYTNECHRLYGVLDTRLTGRDYICDDYSIADMASFPWVLPGPQGVPMDDFPALQAWMDRMNEREAVKIAKAMTAPPSSGLAGTGADAEKARAILFGQRARK